MPCQSLTIKLLSFKSHQSLLFTDILFLENLESTGSLIYTPITQSPTTGSTLNCYDDRFILDIAAEDKAVVVSNDLYRDLAKENPAYWETIAYRLLGFTFSENR